MSEGQESAVLLALDWGTSSLRAYLLGEQGQVLQERHSSHGIQHLPQAGAAGFEQALASIAADWLQNQPRLPVVAGGMVGSAQGWKEAPYVRCPASMETLAQHCVQVRSQLGVDIMIAPGVLLDDPAQVPDVMRGEEIQIAGALAQGLESERACVVLPGTHSKWVWLDHGAITQFATYMTGELFAVLRQHSILGRLLPLDAVLDPALADAAFLQGLDAAQEADGRALTHQLFAARTLGLTQRLAPEYLADYLSGLLIGHELISGLAQARPLLEAGAPLLLIGDAKLCLRYRLALTHWAVPVARVLENPAPQGLWLLARSLGLLN